MAGKAQYQIHLKRVYEDLLPQDGKRFLVDRLWPRGIQKQALSSVKWLRDVAPSVALRKWFQHDSKKWPEFQKRYRLELKNNAAAWKPLLEAIRQDDVTLLFATRSVEINHAIVLKKFLEQRLRSTRQRQRS